jgi:hypothetical protein
MGTTPSHTYYDDATYSGPIGPFQKPSRFAYQQEFRIVLRAGVVPFRNLIVGDLSDITTPVLPLSELGTVCDFSEQVAIEAGWVRIELSGSVRGVRRPLGTARHPQLKQTKGITLRPGIGFRSNSIISRGTTQSTDGSSVGFLHFGQCPHIEDGARSSMTVTAA